MDINSGYIFQELVRQWERYDRTFLQELEPTLQHLLLESNICTYGFPEKEEGANPDYINNYTEIRYPRDLKESEKATNFPFPNYFLHYDRESLYPVIISYGEPLMIPKDDDSFDLFFALKLSLTDIMEIKSFLEYQLKKNFETKKNKYREYLELILVKYNDFLANGKTDIITNRYISEKLIDKQKKIGASQSIISQNQIDSKETNKEFTTSRQVLAMHYLLSEFRIYGRTDKTEIARFIQFLTGKESGATKITDTTIYKKVKSPLPKNEKTILSDLQFVRWYFEKLGLQVIVDKINKEMSKKE